MVRRVVRRRRSYGYRRRMPIMSSSFLTCQKITDTLYTQWHQYLQQQVADLVSKNNLLQGSDDIYGDIRYLGKLYTSVPDEVSGGYHPVFDLHAELDFEFNKWLKLREEIELEYSQVTQFMAILFNFAQAEPEIAYLLGDSLYPLVRDLITDAVRRHKPDNYNYQHRLPELEMFKEEYSEILDAMQNRFVDNLLVQTLFKNIKTPSL